MKLTGVLMLMVCLLLTSCGTSKKSKARELLLQTDVQEQVHTGDNDLGGNVNLVEDNNHNSLTDEGDIAKNTEEIDELTETVQMTAGELLSMSKAEIDEVFGEEVTVSESAFYDDYSYDDMPYTVSIINETLNAEMKPFMVNFNEDGGVLEPDKAMIGESFALYLNLINRTKGDDVQYYENSILGEGYPVILYREDSLLYIVKSGAGGLISDVIVRKETTPSIVDTNAETYLGSTFQNIIDIFGYGFKLVENKGLYYQSYTGYPLMFYYDAKAELSKDSQVIMIKVDSGFNSEWGVAPTLLGITLDEVENRQDDLNVINLDTVSQTCILKEEQYIYSVMFSNNEQPNDLLIMYQQSVAEDNVMPINYSLKDVIRLYGTPDNMIEEYGSVFLKYNDALTFAFAVDDFGDTSRPLSVHYEGGNEALMEDVRPEGMAVDVFLESYVELYSYYFAYFQNIFNQSKPIIVCFDDTHGYILYLNDEGIITGYAALNRVDELMSYTNAHQYLGMTYVDLNNIFGAGKVIEQQGANTLFTYYGIPYIYRFTDLDGFFDEKSIVNMVIVNSIPIEVNGVDLMNVSMDEFRTNYQDSFDIIQTMYDNNSVVFKEDNKLFFLQFVEGMRNYFAAIDG